MLFPKLLLSLSFAAISLFGQTPPPDAFQEANNTTDFRINEWHITLVNSSSTNMCVSSHVFSRNPATGEKLDYLGYDANLIEPGVVYNLDPLSIQGCQSFGAGRNLLHHSVNCE